MKKIIIIIVIGLSLLALHCKRTTEQIMMKRIDETSLYDISRIIKIDVIDTLYQSNIDEALKLDTLRLEFLKDKYQLFDSLKNEVRKTPRPDRSDTNRMKYNKSVFDSLMTYERWIEMVNDKNRLHQRIGSYYNNKTDITGYRVIVHYKDGRTNDFVIQSDYTLLCPYFMYEPVDSIFKFRPDFRRHEQRPNRPNQRRMPIDRPRGYLPRVVE
jgi:hypothetical protein